MVLSENQWLRRIVSPLVTGTKALLILGGAGICHRQSPPALLISLTSVPRGIILCSTWRHLRDPARWTPNAFRELSWANLRTGSRSESIFTWRLEWGRQAEDAQLPFEKPGFQQAPIVCPPLPLPLSPFLLKHTHCLPNHLKSCFSPLLASLPPPQLASRPQVPLGCGCTLWWRTHSSQEPSRPGALPQPSDCQSGKREWRTFKTQKYHECRTQRHPTSAMYVFTCTGLVCEGCPPRSRGWCVRTLGGQRSPSPPRWRRTAGRRLPSKHEWSTCPAGISSVSVMTQLVWLRVFCLCTVSYVLKYLSISAFLQRGLYHNVALHAHLELGDFSRHTAFTGRPQRAQELASSNRVHNHSPILTHREQQGRFREWAS